MTVLVSSKMRKKKTRRSDEELLSALSTHYPAAGSIEQLVAYLTILDEMHKRWTTEHPGGLGVFERAWSLYALNAVLSFLKPCEPEVLTMLTIALVDVEFGGHPAIFQPQASSRKRPADSSIVQRVKGYIAGFTHKKQKEGMTLRQATTWVAQNMAPDLARKLAPRGVTQRTVREWVDRYGGEHPPRDSGGRGFKFVDTLPESKLTESYLREMTATLARLIPVRTNRQAR
jgi:hypothetical protein